MKDEDLTQYFKAGQSWDQEVCATMRISKNRAWIISMFCMAVSVLSLMTLLLLLPLKTFEPYILTVDRQTGYVEMTKGLTGSNLSEDMAVTQSNLVRYLSVRESYNPSILRENYDFVVLMSEGKALQEFQKLWNAQNPDNPSIKLGRSASIDIKIKSVSLLNDKTASVRFLREQRDHEQVKISHWNAILDFHYVQKPAKMAERFSNPLGFQVTNYRINPEGLESIR